MTAYLLAVVILCVIYDIVTIGRVAADFFEDDATP